MGVCDETKWSCPHCNRTVSVYASAPDTRAAIDAIQRRHADAHRAAAVVVARLGFPNPLRPARRRSA